MKYHRLGKSALHVSHIAFGCMSLGNDDVANSRLLREAVDQGINFFDTADLYAKGSNEETVGKAFSGMRDQVIIATKVGNQWRADGSGWDWNASPSYILQAVEKSLKRLQTDYIDLYQLHGGTLDDPIDETIRAFELLKQQGKIRAYGISSIRPNVIREYVKRSSIDSVMMQYSLLDRRPEETCLDLLHQNQVSVLVRGSLAQGLLIDKATATYLTITAEEVAATTQALKSLVGTSAQAAAIGFVLAHPAVAAAVVGIRHHQQLREILQAASNRPLTLEELDYLRSVSKAVRYEQHR